MALFYPGVPLRKLYKRYSTKLAKHKAAVITGEGKQLVPENNMQVRDGEKNQKKLGGKEGEQEAENKHLVGKRGRGKRKLSSDGEVSQEKKIARRRGDFSVTLPPEDQSVSTDQSVKKNCKKRRKGDDDDDDQAQQQMAKGRRLSTRLQKKKTSEESSVDDKLLQSKNSTNRKKRKRTTDSQEDDKGTPDLSKEQEKSSDVSVMSNNEESLADGFVSDAMWTDLYRPVHSTEVMANASAVSKLRSWLEEWKVKREKTLRKELQQQKRYSIA